MTILTSSREYTKNRFSILLEEDSILRPRNKTMRTENENENENVKFNGKKTCEKTKKLKFKNNQLTTTIHNTTIHNTTTTAIRNINAISTIEERRCKTTKLISNSFTPSTYKKNLTSILSTTSTTSNNTALNNNTTTSTYFLSQQQHFENTLYFSYFQRLLAHLLYKLPFLKLLSPKILRFIVACIILDELVPDDYNFESENFGCFEEIENDGLFCLPLELLDNIDDLYNELYEYIDGTFDSFMAQLMDEVDWVHTLTSFKDHFLPNTHPTTMQGLRGWMSFVVAYTRTVFGTL